MSSPSSSSSSFLIPLASQKRGGIMSTTTTSTSTPLDPETKTLLRIICKDSLSQGKTSRNDIEQLVEQYKSTYPQLTAGLIEGEIQARQQKKEGRRVGRPSKKRGPEAQAGVVTGEAAAVKQFTIEKEDVKLYRGSNGEQRLMRDLLTVMPEDKNVGRYNLLTKHVSEYGVGHLDGLGYSTFNSWVRGLRKAKGLDWEHKKAMISYIKVNTKAGSKVARYDGGDDYEAVVVPPLRKKTKRSTQQIAESTATILKQLAKRPELKSIGVSGGHRRRGRPSKMPYCPSKAGSKEEDDDDDNSLAIQDEDLEIYAGSNGEQKLMTHLIAAMPDKSNTRRYYALENHVSVYGIGHLDGFGYSTFNDWMRGYRKADWIDLEHKKAMLSFIRMNGGVVAEGEEDGVEDDDEAVGDMLSLIGRLNKDADKDGGRESVEDARQRRRRGRPSKLGNCRKDGAEYANLAIKDEDLAIYAGSNGEQQLMDDLLAAMPGIKANTKRYKALENHITKFGIGNLYGLGYSTFNDWVRGQRKADGIRLENIKAMISYIKANASGGKGRVEDEAAGRARKKCTAKGCTKRATKGSVCNRHGAGMPCSTPGCKNKAVESNDVCFSHGATITRTKSLCSGEWCENKVDESGLCRTHTKPCRHDGCTNKVVIKGLCEEHGAQEKAFLII